MKIALTVQLEPEQIPPDNPRRGNWRGVLHKRWRICLNAEAQTLDAELIPSERVAAKLLLSKGGGGGVAQSCHQKPKLAWQDRHRKCADSFSSCSDSLDQYAKGLLVPSAQDGALVSPKTAELFDQLRQAGVVQRKFAWRFFVRADSRFPALAGIAGAVKGSLLAILVCLFLSFPVGVAAAVWFEDFAPEVGARSDLFRINVYNLAAVPSIIFGLLGLAVFLNFFSMPRGAPLVGGMVLALMTLPTVIVVSASALRAVPSNLREAALALGASAKKRSCTMFCPMLCQDSDGYDYWLSPCLRRNRNLVVDWHDRVSDFCA